MCREVRAEPRPGTDRRIRDRLRNHELRIDLDFQPQRKKPAPTESRVECETILMRRRDAVLALVQASLDQVDDDAAQGQVELVRMRFVARGETRCNSMQFASRRGSR